MNNSHHKVAHTCRKCFVINLQEINFRLLLFNFMNLSLNLYMRRPNWFEISLEIRKCKTFTHLSQTDYLQYKIGWYRDMVEVGWWGRCSGWECGVIGFSWWRHQMETFSALLDICAGNSPVSGEFPTHRPATLSFDVFFDLRLNKRLNKQS